jgi:hypothetical protein
MLQVGCTDAAGKQCEVQVGITNAACRQHCDVQVGSTVMCSYNAGRGSGGYNGQH